MGYKPRSFHSYKNKNMNLLKVCLLFVFAFEASHSQQSNTGDFTTTSNKRFFNCWKRAAQICRAPCRGRECSAKCTVKCGFLGKVCDPITCEASNPSECTAGSGGSTAGCGTGYTQVEVKCYKVNTGPVNYLTALTSCIADGATLASVETEEEYNTVYSLTGSTGAWIGLTDFLDEGNFSWIDGAVYDPTTSYTNWMNNQPNNANTNQNCVWIRPDGRWDDITCKKSEAYVCQKTARS